MSNYSFQEYQKQDIISKWENKILPAIEQHNKVEAENQLAELITYIKNKDY